MERGHVKREASLLALDQGLVLERRRRYEVWGVRGDGTEVRISESDRYDRVWHDATAVLRGFDCGAMARAPEAG